MIKPILALTCPEQYLLDELLQVLLIDMVLEALSLVRYHLGKEHLRAVEGRDHDAGKPDHLF